jgi:hypothetical protein
LSFPFLPISTISQCRQVHEKNGYKIQAGALKNGQEPNIHTDYLCPRTKLRYSLPDRSKPMEQRPSQVKPHKQIRIPSPDRHAQAGSRWLKASVIRKAQEQQSRFLSIVVRYPESAQTHKRRRKSRFLKLRTGKEDAVPNLSGWSDEGDSPTPNPPRIRSPTLSSPA